MVNAKRFILGVVMLVGLMEAGPSEAQYFRNNAVAIPTIGWMGFDSSLAKLNSTPWGLGDELLIGFGVMHGLSEDVWWLLETMVGFGKANLVPPALTSGMASLHAATGIRYDFMSQEIRPFVGAYFHYIHFIVDSTQWQSPAHLLDWVAFRPAAGIEMFVGDNMSVQADASYLLFLNFDAPFRQALMARASYLLYF